MSIVMSIHLYLRCARGRIGIAAATHRVLCLLPRFLFLDGEAEDTIWLHDTSYFLDNRRQAWEKIQYSERDDVVERSRRIWKGQRLQIMLHELDSKALRFADRQHVSGSIEPGYPKAGLVEQEGAKASADPHIEEGIARLNELVHQAKQQFVAMPAVVGCQLVITGC